MPCPGSHRNKNTKAGNGAIQTSIQCMSLNSLKISHLPGSPRHFPLQCFQCVKPQFGSLGEKMSQQRKDFQLGDIR
ncbi:hypothetical protein M2192_009077 [Bradyrhizobium elkanii USDA 61]|uniref:Uncharacterized protein n=1 Tax=Bradyrhizobium elkanii TaxID=29448 RepID=A0A8I1YAV1_BRAEL|nr:hypothetical protein [Bradyrhizobium elkanii]MCS4012117.1 hypothetical protein [Bradyrhizobium elkanii USDA 61]MCP1933931.1 hypothetical protein [Bradyrhizobium elkanii]MCS3478060.1 hypothetical protein [Bradyrhizobium elkanii]MCS3584834.1 hypothetical protein [Bradyrhizobium elkanii]